MPAVRIVSEVMPRSRWSLSQHGVMGLPSGRVLRVYEADEEPRLDLELVMVRQTGGVAIRGEATFAVDD